MSSGMTFTRLFVLAAVFCSLAASESPPPHKKQHDKRVVCYWESWAASRPGKFKFDADSIDTGLCTNIVYSFAGINECQIQFLDGPTIDLKNRGPGLYRKAAATLKQSNPKLEVTLAVGGASQGSKNFSRMVETEECRAEFIKSAVAIMDQYDFDGIDLNWQNPENCLDRRHFSFLLKDLQKAFVPRNWIVTVAIPAYTPHLEFFHIPSLYRYADYVHVLGFDLAGKWLNRTWHQAAIFPSSFSGPKELNLKSTWDYLYKFRGFPEKTVLGAPLFGRSFLLNNTERNGLWARASTEKAFSGPIIKEDGFIGFNEICVLKKNKKWVDVWDEEAKALYSYDKKHWMSYDDEKSLRNKVQFSCAQRFAGIMVWAIDLDDLNGNCGRGPNPLLTEINRSLANEDVCQEYIHKPGITRDEKNDEDREDLPKSEAEKYLSMLSEDEVDALKKIVGSDFHFDLLCPSDLTKYVFKVDEDYDYEAVHWEFGADSDKDDADSDKDEITKETLESADEKMEF